MKIDFEGFLMEKHAEDYIGTKDCMVDDFADWIGDLSPDDFIEYGNEYCNKFVAVKKDIWSILAKVKGCKPDREDCSFKKCHTWGECVNLVEELEG